MKRIPEAVLDSIRAALPLDQVVGRVVPLRRDGGWLKGCCPFHGERNPSFGVKAGDRHWHCFGCGAHGDVFRFVMDTEGCDFPQAVARCAAEAGIKLEGDIDPGERKPLPPIEAREAVAPRDRTRDIEGARRMWQAANHIGPGAWAAQYLRARCLWPPPPGALDALRESMLGHPRSSPHAMHPVLLCRVDAADGTQSAVHRIYLARQPDGRVGKLGGVDSAKLAFGDLGGGAAIRLGPAAPVMGVAEGPETALAAALLTGLPVWSAVFANGMEKFEPPAECRELVIFADRDKPRAKPWQPEGRGVHAARVLQGRMLARGIATRIREPLPPAEDYADVIAARRAA